MIKREEECELCTVVPGAWNEIRETDSMLQLREAREISESSSLILSTRKNTQLIAGNAELLPSDSFFFPLITRKLYLSHFQEHIFLISLIPS